MTTATPKETVQQSLHPDADVALWKVDASAIVSDAAAVQYFSATRVPGGLVTMGGIEYQPISILAEGFAMSAQGASPRPTISFDRLNPTLQLLLQAVDGDPRGATITRTLTFRRYLDDGADPDPTQTYAPEPFRVLRIASKTRERLDLELASALDQGGVQFPRHVLVRGFCDYIYRRWNATTGSFDVDAYHPCPYDGAAMFTKAGVATADSASDVCGKRLPDCRLRFGQAGTLPYRGEPAAQQLR